MRYEQAIGSIQGGYYLATGIWPLVSIETFQRVTGYKTDNFPTGDEADHWLVNTVAVLVSAIGVAMLYAVRQPLVASEIVVLAIAAAIGLTAIDLVYVFRGVLSQVYLVDAVLQISFIAAWTAAAFMRRKKSHRVTSLNS